MLVIRSFQDGLGVSVGVGGFDEINVVIRICLMKSIIDGRLSLLLGALLLLIRLERFEFMVFLVNASKNVFFFFLIIFTFSESSKN